MTLQEIADKIAAKASGSGFGSSVKFDTGADGVIVLDGSSVSTTDSGADCTIKLSTDDLESLIARVPSPNMALMHGKSKGDGDRSVSLRSGDVL